MNLHLIAVSKLDGGYLISTDDSEAAVRVSWEDASFLIKKWLDDPPQKKEIKTLNELMSAINEKNLNTTPPDWVQGALGED